MDIEKNLEELKKRTYLINGVEIDFKGFQLLIPEVFNRGAHVTDEQYKEKCEAFKNISERLVNGIGEIQAISNVN